MAISSNNENTVVPRVTSARKVLTGTIIYSVACWFYDYIVYSFALWHLGVLLGGLVMAILSIPFDLITLRFYDWSKQDWFALEYIKNLRNYEGRNWIKLFMKWVITSTPTPVQVFILSFKFNSFLVTALLRKGAYEFSRLTRRDWAIFWGSFMVGQIYWIIVIGAGVEILEAAYEYLLK